MSGEEVGMISRGQFLVATGALTLGAGAGGAAARVRLSACTVGLDRAREAGLDGVEVGVGGPEERLWISRPETIAGLKREMKRTGLPISSFMMGLLNDCPLATDPRGPAWLEQCIAAAQALEVRVILVAFFGSGSLLDGRAVRTGHVDAVVERLRNAAPVARRAGVTLAIENTLSAVQNLEILKRVGSPAVGVYYDVGNLTGMGYDVPAEIRALGGRISCIHFKDGGSYLGEGRVPFGPIGKAMRAIGYRGWVVLESAAPSGDAVADAKRNAAFVRRLLG